VLRDDDHSTLNRPFQDPAELVLSLSRCKRGRLALFASMGVRVGKSIPPFAIESNRQRRCLFEQLRLNSLPKHWNAPTRQPELRFGCSAPPASMIT